MSNSEQEIRYYAFISYRHVEPDQTWAKWLHSSIETYRVPKRLVKERNLPARIQPLFRDEEELAASSNLSESIQNALEQSRFLIVVCSLKASESKWINKEVRVFSELGHEDNILSLLINGEPASSFPLALREVRQYELNAPSVDEESEMIEPLAADVRPKVGVSSRHLKRMAKLRIIARILGCEFDELRQRDQERRIRNIIKISVLSFSLVIVFAGLAFYGLQQRGETRRGQIDLKLVEDTKREPTPFDVDRWHLLNSLLTEAKEADYPNGISVITKRLSCLLPPSARQEKAQFDELPAKFLVNNSGTRICAIYKDKLEIREAQTYKLLSSSKLPRALANNEKLYAVVDNAHDRIIYSSDELFGRPFYPREYFVKSFDESPIFQIKVSEQFEGIRPANMLEEGIKLRLKLLTKLTSPEGEFHDRSEIIDRLKLRLGLGELSGIVRVDYDPVTELGMYRIYTLDHRPPIEGELAQSTESVVVYDGGSRLIKLLEGIKSKVFVRKSNSSKLEFAILNYLAALNARHQVAILDDKLFRFSDNQVLEVIKLDLPTDEIKYIEMTPDGEGILIEFNDVDAGTGSPNSLGLYQIRNKSLHRVLPFNKIVWQSILPATKQVWMLTNDKKFETWDISVFQSNGWAASACP